MGMMQLSNAISQVLSLTLSLLTVGLTVKEEKSSNLIFLVIVEEGAICQSNLSIFYAILVFTQGSIVTCHACLYQYLALSNSSSTKAFIFFNLIATVSRYDFYQPNYSTKSVEGVEKVTILLRQKDTMIVCVLSIFISLSVYSTLVVLSINFFGLQAAIDR